MLLNCQEGSYCLQTYLEGISLFGSSDRFSAFSDPYFTAGQEGRGERGRAAGQHQKVGDIEGVTVT